MEGKGYHEPSLCRCLSLALYLDHQQGLKNVALRYHDLSLVLSLASAISKWPLLWTWSAGVAVEVPDEGWRRVLYYHR